MKDYRSFKRYTVEEWETDKTWLGKRMSFLWDMRSYYTETYLKNKLNEELQDDFYGMNDNEVSAIARKDSNYKHVDFVNWSNWTLESIYKNYIRLKKLKKDNKKEFLKRCNCFLYTFINEQRYEELREYIYDNELRWE